jgi:diguanylate cyclase (GGDEF)-like protein
MITIEGFLLGCFLIMAIYHMFLFIFYKKNYASLYFSLITFGASALTVVKGVTWIFKYKFIFIIFIIIPLFYVEFTKNMYPNEFNNKISKFINKIIYIYVFFFSFFIIFIPMEKFGIIMFKLQHINFIINILLIVYIFIQLIRASIKKESDAKIILLGYVILFISAIAIYNIPSNTFSKSNPIGAIGILLLYSITLAKRYSNAYRVCEKVVDDRTYKLQERNHELIKLINYDSLTGIHSRRYIFDKFDELFNLHKNNSNKLHVISFDIDHFKNINDGYGHPIGDRVLIKLTKTVKEMLNENEIFGRIGGEEFIIILFSDEKELVIEKAETIREKIEQLLFTEIDSKLKVTCSFGVTSKKSEMQNYDDMLIEVDKLLYKAKNNGRNQVCHNY